MKRLAPTVFLGLMLSGLSLFAGERDQDGARHDGIAKLKELIIDDLTVKEARAPEVLDRLRAIWFEAHPSQSFPLVCLEFEEARTHRLDSFSLRNMSAYEALKGVLDCHPLKTTTQLDMILATPLYQLDGDGIIGWGHFIAEWQCKALGLPPAGASREDDQAAALRRRLEDLGLDFSKSGEVLYYYVTSGEPMIHMRNMLAEQKKYFGLLQYVKDGYIVKKLPDKP